MAVHAQYPSSSSSLFLLNNNNTNPNPNPNPNRNAQEGTDYSYPGGGLIQQPQMLFNNGVTGTNVPKRVRDIEPFLGGAGGGAIPINLFSLQPQQQPPTLVNLSQLHTQPPQQQQQQSNALVSTGLRLSLEEQQHQQRQQQQSLLHLSSSSSSDDLSLQMKQHRDEIDHLLQLQGEELRRTLAERRQKHYRALLGAAEETAARRLKAKETQVHQTRNRNAELESRMAQLRLEAQAWEAKARTQEAHVASLQTQLQQAMMLDNHNNYREEGGGGGGRVEGAEDAESAHVDPERVEVVSKIRRTSGGPICKACRRREASVVLLPCRHLCLCTNCDAAVEACPLCLSYRSASVEVYLT